MLFTLLSVDAGLLSANTAGSRTRKNPFLFPDEEALLELKMAPAPAAKPAAQKPKPPKKIVQKQYFETNAMIVSAILFSPQKSRAVIDGHIISEGDTFAGRKVIKIDAESVIVEENGYKYIVRLARVGQ